MGATWAALRFDIAVSMPRLAAEGGEGLGLGDFVPAALAMGFVIGVDAAVLSVADAAGLTDPGVTKIAVLDCLEPAPSMAERLADQCSGRHHDGVPEFRVLGVQVVVNVVKPHPQAPAKRPAPVALAQRFSDEFSNLFEHRNSSPAVHRQAYGLMEIDLEQEAAMDKAIRNHLFVIGGLLAIFGLGVCLNRLLRGDSGYLAFGVFVSGCTLLLAGWMQSKK
jgi:hypothetical protein